MKKLFLLLLITLISAGPIQPVIAQGFSGPYGVLNLRRGQEKLFVHTSKSFFVTGELIWFKIYYTDVENRPETLSKLAYVDVLDGQNKPLLQAKISLRNGSGSGSLFIPVTASSGAYRLRAYTALMKNFGPETYFEKPLTIFHPQQSPQQAKAGSPPPAIGFFPEGGDLVEGLPAVVGVKITGNDGKGLDLAGAILNQRNDTIARVPITKFGMSQFSFLPVAGDRYRAVFRSGSDVFTHELPAAKKAGYSLHVAESSSLSLEVTIRAANLPADSVYLVVHKGRTVVAAQRSAGAVQTATFSIDQNRLPEGISTITLFNSAQQPVAERLWFKRPSQQLQIVATTDSGQYHLRKQVQVTVSTRDDRARVQPSDLSMTVYRVDSLQHPDEATISGYLWLGSGLAGQVESPEYYLTSTAADVKKAIDNLLLTQGWRRYKPEDMSPVAKFQPETDGHLVTGKLTNPTGGPVANQLVYMGVAGKRYQVYSAKSDTTGHFSIPTKNLFGANELVMQLNSELDSTTRIELLNPFSDQVSPAPPISFTADPGIRNALERYNLSSQVQLVYSGPEMRKFTDPAVDTTAFYGAKFKSYLLDAYTRFPTMEEVLREFIPEVDVYRKQKRYHLWIMDSKGLPLREGKPLFVFNGVAAETMAEKEEPFVLLDGVPFFNMDRVLAIDPLKVKKLEVVPQRYYWGPTSSEGIISFITYKNDLGGTEIDPHAIVLDYEGMQLQREFYAPVYATPEQAASRLPDFRNVLYWTPELATGNQGTARAGFYTSDLPGTYLIDVQGVTASGLVGSTRLMIQVKK